MVKSPHDLPTVVGSVGSGVQQGLPRPLHRTASGNYLKPGGAGDHHNVHFTFELVCICNIPAYIDLFNF